MAMPYYYMTFVMAYGEFGIAILVSVNFSFILCYLQKRMAIYMANLKIDNMCQTPNFVLAMKYKKALKGKNLKISSTILLGKVSNLSN